MPFYKIISILISILFFTVCYTQPTAFATANEADSNGDMKLPQSRNMPEENLPAGTDQENTTWLDKYKWWLLFAATIVAGGAYALTRNNPDPDPAPPANNEGEYKVTW